MATHLCLLAVQFIFAAFPVVAKIAFREVSPWALAWIRLAIAALILLVWFYGFARERIEPADLRKLFLLSVFGVSLNQLCYLRGLSLTTAINATILVGMIPVFTFLVALVLGRESTSLPKTAGVFLGFAGVFVLAGPGSVSFESQYTFGNAPLDRRVFLRGFSCPGSQHHVPLPSDDGRDVDLYVRFNHDASLRVERVEGDEPSLVRRVDMGLDRVSRPVCQHPGLLPGWRGFEKRIGDARFRLHLHAAGPGGLSGCANTRRIDNLDDGCFRRSDF